MLIGFIGSHGTGKTTTAKEYAAMAGSTALLSSSREVHGAGLPINKEATRLTQLMITVARANQAHTYGGLPGGDYVADRTPLDSYAYTHYQIDNVWKPDPELDSLYIRQTHSLVTAAMEQYDHLFFFPVYWSAKGDDARIEDDVYQAVISDRIISLLNLGAWRYTTVPNVSPLERAHFIQATVAPAMV
jgi:AAA domain